jgi:hypothetical protein
LWQQLIQWLFCDLIRWLFCEAITFFSLLTLSLYFTSSKSLSISHHQNLNVLAYVLKKCKTTNQTNHNFKTPTIPTNNMQHRHRSHQQKETRRASHWDISTNTGSASRLWLSPQLESAHESADNGVKRRKRNYHHGVVPSPHPNRLQPPRRQPTRPRKAGDVAFECVSRETEKRNQGHGSQLQARTTTARRRGVRIGADGRRRKCDLCSIFTFGCLAWWGAASTLPPWRCSPPDLIWLQLGVFTGLTEREGEGVSTTYHLPFFRAWFYLFQAVRKKIAKLGIK